MTAWTAMSIATLTVTAPAWSSPRGQMSRVPPPRSTRHHARTVEMTPVLARDQRVAAAAEGVLPPAAAAAACRAAPGGWDAAAACREPPCRSEARRYTGRPPAERLEAAGTIPRSRLDRRVSRQAWNDGRRGCGVGSGGGRAGGGR